MNIQTYRCTWTYYYYYYHYGYYCTTTTKRMTAMTGRRVGREVGT